MKSFCLIIAALFLFVSGFGQCPVINVTGVIADAACYNQKNGSVKLSVNGGLAPYTYKWSNLTTARDLNNVYAGTYSVVVTDANGCEGMQTFSLAQPDEIVVNAVGQDPACYNSNTGSIIPSATGGSGVFSYSFEDGNSTFSSLHPGTYEIIATDSRGCIGRTAVELTAPAPIEILSITSKKYLGYNVSCNGAGDGEIAINATGGTGPLEYAVNGGAFQSGNVITGLSAGTHVVSVKDQNGCILTNDYQSMIDNPGIIISPPVTLIAPSPLELGPINANPWQLLGGYPNTVYQGYGPQWIVLAASEINGGAGTSFSYQWTSNTGAPISNPTEAITQTTPTETTVYQLTVTDNNGCAASTQATVYVVDARCVSQNSNSANKKVMMCHNGTEICVSLNSLSMSQHLQHGDKIGPCSFTGTNKTRQGVQQLESADEDLAQMLEVHPNPSAGRFRVKTETGKRMEIQVVDVTGVVIERRTGGNNTTESFDLTGRPAGLYYIRTVSDEGIQSVRIWIRR